MFCCFWLGGPRFNRDEKQKQTQQKEQQKTQQKQQKKSRPRAPSSELEGVIVIGGARAQN